MNRQEAAQVMLVLQTLPYGAVDDVKLEVWWQAALQDCPADVGFEVAQHLVKTSEEFPAPAMFNAHRRRIERRDDVFRALPAARVDRETALGHIAAIRAQLRGEVPWTVEDGEKAS